MAQMETKVSYVARLPTPIESIKEWQKEMTRLLPKELDLIHWLPLAGLQQRPYVFRTQLFL